MTPAETQSIEEIGKALTEALRSQLGTNYRVLREHDAPLSKEDYTSLGVIPDILVYNESAKHFTLVEIIGTLGTDLSLATTAIIKRMKAFYL